MPIPIKPVYDFEDPRFRRVPQYIRLAKEHIDLADMESDVIDIDVIETEGPLRIPIKYQVHYRLNTIVAVNEATREPIYGQHHTMEISLTPQYPVEACKIYMLTDVWHPNIKSEGPYKGRICGNQKNFGKSYDLYQLILRVGEILQYKNYHADHTPPFPEDANVAYWVKNVGEPNGIVNKDQQIFTDDSPLVGISKPKPAPEPLAPAEPPAIEPVGGIRFGQMRKKITDEDNPAPRPKFTFR